MDIHGWPAKLKKNTKMTRWPALFLGPPWYGSCLEDFALEVPVPNSSWAPASQRLGASVPPRRSSWRTKCCRSSKRFTSYPTRPDRSLMIFDGFWWSLIWAYHSIYELYVVNSWLYISCDLWMLGYLCCGEDTEKKELYKGDGWLFDCWLWGRRGQAQALEVMSSS